MKKKFLLLILPVLLLIGMGSAIYHTSDTCTYTIVNQELTDYNNKVVAAGGSLSDDKLAHYDTLINKLKQQGLWYKKFELGTLDSDPVSAKYKLKYVFYDTLTINGFTSGDYNVNTGFTGNGTSKYLDLNYDLTGVDIRSFSFGFYSHSEWKGCGMGQGNGTKIYLGYSNGTENQASSGVAPNVHYSGMTTGFYSLHSTFQGSYLYTNSTFRSARTVGSVANNPLSGEMHLFRYNNGAANTYSTGKISMYFISEELTTEDIKVLSDAIAHFYEGIGRKQKEAIICFGDSKTSQLKYCTSAQTWPQILGDSMNREVINLGFKGTLWQIDLTGQPGYARFAQDILAYTNNYDSIDVFIMMGTNDYMHNAGSLGNYCSQMRSALRYLKNSGVDSNDIYLITPSYVDSINGYTAASPLNAGTLAKHKTTCDSVMVIASDLGVHGIQMRDWQIANGGNSNLGADYIHEDVSGNLNFANKAYDETK